MTSLGLQIGYIIAFIALPVLFFVAVAGLFAALLSKHDGISDAGVATAGTSGAIFGIGLVIFAIFAFPYNPHYWQLYSVEGAVTKIYTSVQSAGKSISNYYVITLTGHDEYFVTENPRILDLKGRTVDLVCHANYVYQGADNYDCNIRSIRAAS